MSGDVKRAVWISGILLSAGALFLFYQHPGAASEKAARQGAAGSPVHDAVTSETAAQGVRSAESADAKAKRKRVQALITIIAREASGGSSPGAAANSTATLRCGNGAGTLGIARQWKPGKGDEVFAERHAS